MAACPDGGGCIVWRVMEVMGGKKMIKSGPPEDRVIYVRNQYYGCPLAAELNHACIPVWQSIVGSCSCGGDS